MEEFGAAWNEIAPGLRRYVRGRGVAMDDVDDVVQEVALRLLVAWPRLDTTTSVEPLARTIGLNVWRDRMRCRASSDVVVADVPDAQDTSGSVERVVVARDEVRRVAAALARLSRDDRAVVHAAASRDLGLGGDMPSSARDRMRLMRCRRSLRAAFAAPAE